MVNMYASHRRIKTFLLTLIYALAQMGCQEEIQTVPSKMLYKEPQYKNIGIVPKADTVSFPLSEHMYNTIKSFNVFNQNGNEYISFYDERAGLVYIYNFLNQRLVLKMHLKKHLRHSLVKTTVYAKSFDSIFINNQTTLYLLDSSGKIKQSVDFLEKPKYAWAVIKNANPLVLKNGRVYVSVRPNVQETSFKALKKWKVLYEFNMDSPKATLFYSLPPIYQKNIYGYYLLDNGYCYNDRGNFVFSFPADTLIYETNLSDFHVSYYAKSIYQKGIIDPINEKDIKGGNELHFKQYKLRDSYGPIYFDPYRKRYLRLAKQKVSVSDYDSNKTDRSESVIVFNQDFVIIGEEPIKNEYSFNSLFFTSNGNMYARVKEKDEYALHFVRMDYSDSVIEPVQLTKR